MICMATDCKSGASWKVTIQEGYPQVNTRQAFVCGHHGQDIFRGERKRIGVSLQLDRLNAYGQPIVIEEAS